MIPHPGSFLSILILWCEPANLSLSVLFRIKGIFDQRIIGMTHHTRPYTFIIIYSSKKDEKKRGVCSTANEREPEVFVDSDARLWDSTCRSSKATWGEVKSRCHLHIPSSPFCMYRLHLTMLEMLCYVCSIRDVMHFYASFLPSHRWKTGWWWRQKKIPPKMCLCPCVWACGLCG